MACFPAATIGLKKKIDINREVFPNYEHRFTEIYHCDREYLFDSTAPGFFAPANRSRIVWFILVRTSYVNTEKSKHTVFSFGIERLVSSHVYSAAYPLHDGDLLTPGSMRYKLYHHWACIHKWYRYQPIDHIKQYFGVKIALYFAWVGFYTRMLIYASVGGLACFLFSIFLLAHDQPTEDICSGALDAEMCPLCDYYCNYWDISDTCLDTKIKNFMDNYATVFFAVFMSFWAALFLEMWKRYSAEITHRWDLTGFDTQDEYPRPQYVAKLGKLKKVVYKHNVITDSHEPSVPYWKTRFPSTIVSYSAVLMLVCLAISTVIGVTLYRMSLLAALSVNSDSVVSDHATIITSISAAVINLVFIFIFNWIYAQLAEYLTELEMLRTQTEFDNSFTLKMYLLQFVNYYASIFYIAFCKGKLVGFPAKYNRIFGFRREECGAAGCFMELSIQLATIMVGKQAFLSSVKVVKPIVMKWWMSKQIKQRSNPGSSQWEKDYELMNWGHRALFTEYLEMVLQYGFVTIFVTAFPLAPLFALLNNIFETRMDAKKLIKYYRRPVPRRTKDIGVWFDILNSVSKLAIITNGFIIAFTSDFVPRMVYKLSVSPNHSLTGYMNHSLAYIDVKDLDMLGKPNSSLHYCRFRGYREPPWSPHKYKETIMYYNVMAWRFIFVVAFENIVVMLVLLVQWLIPDVPATLKRQIRTEIFQTNEIIVQNEALRVLKKPTLPQPSSKESLSKGIASFKPSLFKNNAV